MYLRFDIIAVDRFVESVDFAALQAVILMNWAHPTRNGTLASPRVREDQHVPVCRAPVLLDYLLLTV